MQAADPANAYLTRTLATDLQGEVFFRWLLEEPGSASLALETLALFRSLSEVTPGSDEALRARFQWAYVAAVLNDDLELWREAEATGETLQSRGEMRRENAAMLRQA